LDNLPVNLNDVYKAKKSIRDLIVRTPLIQSSSFSGDGGAELYLKLENLQQTGSFKFRGASNKIANLSADEKKRGLITVSSGNHGKAVAYSAYKLGIPATICLSDKTPENKVNGIKKLGGHVLIAGGSYDEAEEVALGIADEQGLVFIDSFDDPLVIAGQGTIGMEIFEDLPDFDNILIPVSGGGLASGIGLFVKTLNPKINVIGVQMERGPVMYESLKAGHPIHLPEEPTLADGLKGGIGKENHYTFDLCRRLLDEILLVTEDEIANAMAVLIREQHLVIEGSGSVGIAAVLSGRFKLKGRTVVVLSGSNVDIPILMGIMSKY
jgi:threonine dehydratase